MYNLVNRSRANSKYNFIILKTAAMFVGNGWDIPVLHARPDPDKQPSLNQTSIGQAYNGALDKG